MLTATSEFLGDEVDEHILPMYILFRMTYCRSVGALKIMKEFKRELQMGLRYCSSHIAIEASNMLSDVPTPPIQ